MRKTHTRKGVTNLAFAIGLLYILNGIIAIIVIVAVVVIILHAIQDAERHILGRLKGNINASCQQLREDIVRELRKK